MVVEDGGCTCGLWSRRVVIVEAGDRGRFGKVVVVEEGGGGGWWKVFWEGGDE